jgi:TolA-binding protein
VLRAICLCSLLTVAVVAGPAYGQAEKDTKAAAATRAKKLQAKLTVTFDDTPLKEVLEELKSQVEAAGAGTVSFKLEPGVSMNQKITFTAKDKPLEQVLSGIFTKVGLGYYVLSKEKDRYDGWVVVKPGKERGYPEGQEPKAGAEKASAKDKAAAKAKPAAKEKAEAGDKDEQAAASKLNLAKDLADNGKTEKARERYQDIIRLYPKTKAAEEARELLDKLKKK